MEIKLSGFEVTNNFDCLSQQISNQLSDLIKLRTKVKVEISSIREFEKLGKMDLWLMRSSQSNGAHVCWENPVGQRILVDTSLCHLWRNSSLDFVI